MAFFVIRATLHSEYIILVTRECSVISRREMNVNRSPGMYFAIEFIFFFKLEMLKHISISFSV